MSTKVITVMVPHRVVAPRGARWAAVAAVWIARALRWGRARLQSLAQADKEPQTAEELLAYAFRIERQMPGLAADLRAVALRHQAEDQGGGRTETFSAANQAARSSMSPSLSGLAIRLMASWRRAPLR